MHAASRLTMDLAERQHARLQGARARLLRQAGIARCESVLEIGCGWGFAAAEIETRCHGAVTAIDIDAECVAHAQTQFGGVAQVADACQLPFEDGSWDLVFAQFTFLWIEPLQTAMAEAIRVLKSGGALALIEPDYGGMLEHPTDLGLAGLWMETIAQAGGHPCAGRELAAMAHQSGLETEVLLPDRWEPFETDSIDFLSPLMNDAARLAELRAAVGQEHVLVHLPIVMTLGRKLG